MQLSEKRKTLSQFFIPFLGSTSIFTHVFLKKIMLIANVFPKLQAIKNFVRLLCGNPRFVTLFDCQHVKVSQKLAKSP